MKKYLYIILFACITSLGDALNFKTNIGVNPYEALSLTINYLTGIKVGTLSFICNMLFISFQIILDRKVRLKYLLQIPLSLILGSVVNLIVYIFLGSIELNYIMRVIFMLCGLSISAFGVGLFMSLNEVVFPLEGFISLLASKTNKDFTKLRQGADIINIIICIVISLIFHLDFAIREGTIVSALIFSPIMGLTMKKFKNIGKR